MHDVRTGHEWGVAMRYEPPRILSRERIEALLFPIITSFNT